MKRINLLALLMVYALILCFSSTSYAMPILTGTEVSGTWYSETDTWPEGYPRIATAVVTTTGSVLGITLTNTSTYAGVYQPNELLLGVFFDFNRTLVGTPGVSVSTGSKVYYEGSEQSLTNLNGEYGFLTGLNGSNGGLGDYGISGTGFDPIGFGSVIDPNAKFMYGPEVPNGPDFGITGGAADSIDDVTSSIRAWVNNSIYIEWEFEGGMEGASVTQLNFLYGTDFSAPVPEPATMLLLGSGLIGLAGFRRKFKKS